MSEYVSQRTFPSVLYYYFTVTRVICNRSRAILTYLVNRYVPHSPLYPMEPRNRAAVDRFLYFDMGSLFKSFTDVLVTTPLLRVLVSPNSLDSFVKHKVEVILPRV